jgi:hypothetical protein
MKVAVDKRKWARVALGLASVSRDHVTVKSSPTKKTWGIEIADQVPASEVADLLKEWQVPEEPGYVVDSAWLTQEMAEISASYLTCEHVIKPCVCTDGQTRFVIYVEK